jgi:large subunit ribosomal protein L5
MAKKEKSENVKKEVGTVKIPLLLLEKYRTEIISLMTEKFQYANAMEVPKLVKIVVNMGVGEAVHDSKILDAAVKDLETITGQKAQIRAAKTSISNFKLREGMKIGAKVTLRGRKMYEFMNRLISLALPRVRDFRGVPDKSFDGRGNYTLGIKEQIIFPEIDVDKINKVVGMDVTFVTTAKTDNEAYELLLAFGVPFKKKQA